MNLKQLPFLPSVDIVRYAELLRLLWTCKRKGDQISLFRVPAEKKRRQQWLDALQLSENDANEHTRVCSRHFLHGNLQTFQPSI